jgi:hypothetical protein
MKKHLPIFSLIVCLALLVTACNVSVFGVGGDTDTVQGSGNVTTEERPVSGVKRVSLANQGDLTIQIGATERLEIEAEDNLMQYLETDVTAGELEIRTQENVNLDNTKPIRYTLTVTELDGLTISSSGSISAPDMRSDRFSIQISSSGKLEIASLIADRLEVEISSSGDVTVKSGEVPQVDIQISSSGDLDLEKLASQNVTVKLSSSGDARVWVTDTLDGTLSSSGDLFYRGNPQVDVKTSSSGKVVKLGD